MKLNKIVHNDSVKSAILNLNLFATFPDIILSDLIDRMIDIN